jgi:hypothetical protein
VGDLRSCAGRSRYFSQYGRIETSSVSWSVDTGSLSAGLK